MEEIVKPIKKKVTFTLKLTNDKIICLRNMYVPVSTELTTTKIKKVSLLIDEFVYFNEQKCKSLLPLVVNIESEDENLSYDLIAVIKSKSLIDIKPILQNIYEIIKE